MNLFLPGCAVAMAGKASSSMAVFRGVSVRLCLGLLIILAAAPEITAMSLTTDKATNAKPKFVDRYVVGLLAFDNATSVTNLDYLAISLPLMLKEELKTMTDFFVTREDILLDKEEPDWDRPWQHVKPWPVDEALPSRTLDGRVVFRTNEKQAVRTIKEQAGLRKALQFSSELVVRNDQTLDEIAKKQAWHLVLFGEYTREQDGRIRVRVSLYNAVRGIVIGNYHETFPEERILLDLKAFATRMRQALIMFPTASLRVETEPAGALVYLNKQFMGYTPIDIRPVAATNHVLQIRKDGFGMRTFDVSLESNRSYLFREKLLPAADYGIVQVESDPPGANVLVDLVAAGTTPVVLTNLRAGLYRITVEKDGYHSRHRQVEISKGKTNTLLLSLDRVVKGEPTIDERIDNMRLWMNITFWSSAGTLAGYAWTYFNYQDSLSEYYHYRRINDAAGMASAANDVRSWQNTSNIMLNATVGCLAASGYFLVRYLILEDRDLGKASGFIPDGLTVVPDQQVRLHWRF